ncbi:chaperone modulator CbpM [Luteolibacter arcticus]|uniref:Chaperone modulator CbpM n=1 Tax=Luteolibacter arcticus TaxID=1581411 RepID=A0ABT3GQ67_9BACT|nr:chaperone modulator CbpM [Luteolibacter arcticus]MCW1925652.1 chaperone modulator CbpM [Luteolibacter arcticus]
MNSDSEPADGELLDLEAASRLCGLPSEMIVEFTRTKVISVVRGGEPESLAFDSVCLHRLRKIEALHHDLSMTPKSIHFVMDLLDRLESAERELRMMRERLR